MIHVKWLTINFKNNLMNTRNHINGEETRNGWKWGKEERRSVASGNLDWQNDRYKPKESTEHSLSVVQWRCQTSCSRSVFVSTSMATFTLLMSNCRNDLRRGKILKFRTGLAKELLHSCANIQEILPWQSSIPELECTLAALETSTCWPCTRPCTRACFIQYSVLARVSFSYMYWHDNYCGVSFPAMSLHG